jgi:pentapeptide MXKDX repeat protein
VDDRGIYVVFSRRAWGTLRTVGPPASGCPDLPPKFDLSSHHWRLTMSKLFAALALSLFAASSVYAADEMKKDEMKKDGMMHKDEMKKDGMKKDAMKKDEMKKDSMMKKDEMKKDDKMAK